MSDRDLERAFARLRDADRAQAPPFGVLRARAPAGRRAKASSQGTRPQWRLAAAVAVAALAVYAAVRIDTSHTAKPLAELAQPPSARQVEDLIARIDAQLETRLASSDWDSPTDFLLSP